MTRLRLSLVGGHQITLDISEEDARTALVLLNKTWMLPDPTGVLAFPDYPGVWVSARDVVMAETLEVS